MNTFARNAAWRDRIVNNMTERQKFTSPFHLWMERRYQLAQSVQRDFNTLPLEQVREKYHVYIR
jgi:hypothetical protein